MVREVEVSSGIVVEARCLVAGGLNPYRDARNDPLSPGSIEEGAHMPVRVALRRESVSHGGG